MPYSPSDPGLWERGLVRQAPQVALRAGGDAQAAAHHHQDCCRDGSREGHSHIQPPFTLATGRVRNTLPDPQDTDGAVNALSRKDVDKYLSSSFFEVEEKGYAV